GSGPGSRRYRRRPARFTCWTCHATPAVVWASMAHMAHLHYPGRATRPELPTVSHVTIDHLSGTPVYLQLAGLLRARIESGEIEPDRPLPSYTRLMQEHGVARG